MVVKVLSKPNILYRVVCTDRSCQSELECAESDFFHGTRYAMGRECGSYFGLVCPECRQIITKEEMTLVDN